MARQQVFVLYSVDNTTDNVKFSCDGSSVTMTSHSTVVKMVNGVDKDGRKVKDAMFREAHLIIRYED